MAYDEALAQRVRTVLGSRRGISERRMFGGLCFMLDGRMCSGVLGADLIVRVRPDDFADALSEPGARPMDFTGRPMKGFLFVDRRGTGTDEGLAEWIDRGVRCARAQPPKKPKATRAKAGAKRRKLTRRPDLA
jgi:hypothetical protein